MDRKTFAGRRQPPQHQRYRTIAFALSLCLPYVVEATPLPSGNNNSMMEDGGGYNAVASTSASESSSSGSSHLRTAAHRILGYTARHVGRLLAPRDNGYDPPSSSIPVIRPIMAAAEVDHNGKWVIPSGYVILVQKFKPGIIVLSYIIAFIGSLCTLELLVRRTNNAGWRNRLLLTAAGVCFGGVSTFAMHFIFNNSLSLHHPMQDMRMYPSLYLQYDAGFTVLSLVASITAMTIAFFIMGTDMHQWVCYPGRNKCRAEKSRRNGGDEYGKWKKTHSGNDIGGGGVGTLMETAGKVAKWSMVDTGANRGSGSGRGRKSWSSLGKEGSGAKRIPGLDGTDADEDWETYGDGIVMKRDKELDELEFRLGKEAVMLELERRQAPPTPTLTSTTNDSGVFAHAQQQQPPSGPAMPQPIFNPAFRRGSLPTVADHSPSPSAMFTPGFSFGTTGRTSISEAPNDSTTALLQHDTNPPWSAPPPTSDLGFEPYRRRASLPSAAIHTPSPLATRQPATLARIQSLPEPDHDHESDSPSTSRKPSDKGTQSPALSVNAHLSTLGAELPERSPRNSTTRRAFGKVERFLGFDVVTIGDIVKIFITGTIAGFGVAGMHYIGQASITGMPYIAYRPEYVVGSIIIASSAVCIALYIMFIMLRPKLKHTLWSKLAVAVILAAAVCLMHFTGMRGTIYGWPREQAISRQSQLTGTNAAIVGVVTALAFAACVGCAVFFAVSSWAKRRERRRRRRVVVAAVFLDQHDRVLVNSTDGMLPMCDIASLTGMGQSSPNPQQQQQNFPNSTRKSLGAATSSTESSTLGMDLSAGHDAFVSALKMSWSWRAGNSANSTPTPSALTSEAIKGQIAVNSALAEIRRGSQITMGSSVMTPDSRPVRLSIAKFLEMFGNAAGQLAVTVTGQQSGIMRLGVLYDQILTTGWVKLQSSNDTVSKGQLVFLVRRVTSAEERSDLLARHYIFADSTAVAHTIHKSLSVPLEHTIPLLQDISTFCDSTAARPGLKPNTLYAGVAVVQATPFDGLRVLLEKQNRSQLPMRELCSFSPHPCTDTQAQTETHLSGTPEEIAEALQWLDGMNLLSVITRNMILGEAFVGGPRVGQLLSALERAIVPMLDTMLTAEDMWHVLPRLTLHPMLVPLTPGSSAAGVGAGAKSKMSNTLPPALAPGSGSGAGGRVYTPPYLIVFYANYDAAVNTFTDQWLPFSLFRAQNACVMAGQIATAARFTAGPSSQARDQDDGEQGHGQQARRPSKVQFEFPGTGAGGTGTGSIDTAASTNTTTRPPLPDTPPATGLFSGLSNYTFPPRDHDQDDSPSAALPPHMQQMRRTHGGPSIPRRSSLAKQSRFDLDPDAESALRGTTQSDVPGIADWDPDWLLVLLRAKLRADA